MQPTEEITPEMGLHVGKGDIDEKMEENIEAAPWKNVVQDAIQAEVEERSMTVRQAFRLYPKAVFWSFAISLCLIMEVSRLV